MAPSAYISVITIKRSISLSNCIYISSASSRMRIKDYLLSSHCICNRYLCLLVYTFQVKLNSFAECFFLFDMNNEKKNTFINDLSRRVSGLVVKYLQNNIKNQNALLFFGSKVAIWPFVQTHIHILHKRLNPALEYRHMCSHYHISLCEN